MAGWQGGAGQILPGAKEEGLDFVSCVVSGVVS